MTSIHRNHKSYVWSDQRMLEDSYTRNSSLAQTDGWLGLCRNDPCYGVTKEMTLEQALSLYAASELIVIDERDDVRSTYEKVRTVMPATETKITRNKDTERLSWRDPTTKHNRGNTNRTR